MCDTCHVTWRNTVVMRDTMNMYVTCSITLNMYYIFNVILVVYLTYMIGINVVDKASEAYRIYYIREVLLHE